MKPKLRFFILRRDGFRCVYCGRGAPDAELEVDHAIPRSSGGSDKPENLVTACSECNSGKSADGAAAPPPSPVLRVSDMSAANAREALIAALEGPVGCRLTFCATCNQFCTIGAACDPPSCYRGHSAIEVVR
jgi:hypothetical protein